MDRMGAMFAHTYKIVDGSATNGAQLATGTDLPASGSYIDVSDCERVHILCKFGVIDASDAPVLEPKCSDAVGGTLDAIDATALQHTAAHDDDQEWASWTVEVDKLPTDHHFLAVDVEGGVANGSYATVFFLLPLSELPVTQTEAVLPIASQREFVG